MLDPVVVKPDTLSKNASITFGIEPDIIKGRAPIAERINQERDTITKPSFAKSEVFFGFLYTNGTAITRHTRAVMADAQKDGISLKHNAVIIGTTRNNASNKSRTPSVYLTIL